MISKTMKTIITAALCFCSLEAICQIKKVYGECHIISLIYKKDTIRFEFPQIITIKQFGSTPIIPLWTYSKNNYGVKFELIKTNVGLENDIILAKCFYIKDGDSWKEIYKSANLQQGIFIVNPCDFTKDADWTKGGEGGGEDFYFYYMQIIYAY